MSVADRWHTRKPRIVDGAPVPPCKAHSKGRSVLYPSADHGNGDRWQVRWRDEARRQCKANRPKKGGAADETDTEIYAEALDAKIRASLNAGTYVSPQGGATLFAEYGAAWRDGLLHRSSTAERMERVFRLHIDPHFGQMPIKRIKPSTVRAWVLDRSQVLAPSTLAVVYSNLASLFKAAVLDGDIGASPCTGVRLPEAPKHRHFIPTPDQVHTVACTLPARYQALAYLAAGCGLRSGELLGIELDAVDFLRREVDVSQQLVQIVGAGYCLGPPKTATSARTVDLPEVAAVALAELIRAYPPEPIEIEDRTNPRRPIRREARLLFPTRALNPMQRGTWATVWGPARDAAGIPKGVGVHCLRHFFATSLIHEGVNPKAVQLALGHADLMITMNEYVGEWPEGESSTRPIMDGTLGRVPRVRPVAGSR